MNYNDYCNNSYYFKNKLKLRDSKLKIYQIIIILINKINVVFKLL
jgi:hypothetical protein